MSYELKTDDEIIRKLGEKFDQFRRQKAIKDVDLAATGGTNCVVLNKFRKGHGGISLKTFVRLMRGIGELGQLETLLQVPDQFSPTGKNIPAAGKRVRTKKSKPKSFIWGEDK